MASFFSNLVPAGKLGEQAATGAMAAFSKAPVEDISEKMATGVMSAFTKLPSTGAIPFEDISSRAAKGAVSGALDAAASKVLGLLEKVMPAAKEGVYCDIKDSRVAKAYLGVALVSLGVAITSWSRLMGAIVFDLVFGVLILWAVYGCHAKRSGAFLAAFCLVPVGLAAWLVSDLVKKYKK